MIRKWRTVKVFVSSTFRDMHAERDHLLRFVFPELKEKCQTLQIHLIDLDLRWGVSEKDAQEGKALDICLDEIDSCRPFFVGLLGNRYGWIPPGQEHSITAQEIYHAVLHNYIPQQVLDLRQIVTAKDVNKPLTKLQIDCLTRCYQWDPLKLKYLLREDTSSDEQEIIQEVFHNYSMYQRDRSVFLLRSENLTKQLAASNIDDFYETDQTKRNKLDQLKKKIMDSEFQWIMYDDIEEFGRQVEQLLWHKLQVQFGQLVVETEKDWLSKEADYHDLFIIERTRLFVGRKDVLNQLNRFNLQETEVSLFLVTGEPGSGKSALLAHFTEEAIRHHPEWLIIPHFVGASPSSTSIRQTLRRMCLILNRIARSLAEVPEETKELVTVFPFLLQQIAAQRKILIIIDGLNQFEKTDHAQTMRWLPLQLPANVRCVVSTLPGEAYNALQKRMNKPAILELAGLDSSQIRMLVHKYLQEIRHDFPNKQIEQTFFTKIQRGNPLYIMVALEELRVFGLFDKLDRKIARLPETVSALFSQVLERIETDFHPALIRDCLAFIACGKQGMTVEELQTLLKNHAPHTDKCTEFEKLPDMLWARLYRAFGPYLCKRSDVIDFFHGQLREAVTQRYLKEEAERCSTHEILAHYFEQRWSEPYVRALDELPYQLIQQKDWPGLERVLTDLRFIETKCAAGMTYELIADYRQALHNLIETQKARSELQEQEAQIQAYIQDVMVYAKAWTEHYTKQVKYPDKHALTQSPSIALPKAIQSIAPLSNDILKTEDEKTGTHPTRLERIRAFSQFIQSESHALVKFAPHPGFVLQQALNSAQSGPVTISAEAEMKSVKDRVILLRTPCYRPEFRTHSTVLKTLEGHTEPVLCVKITPDAKVAVSGSKDETVRIWNCETGEALAVFTGHTDFIYDVTITPDGKKAISGSGDKTLRVWDLEHEICLKVLSGHMDMITGVCITPDGKRIVSISRDHTIRVWDCDQGVCIKLIEVPTKSWPQCISITPDGNKAITGLGYVGDLLGSSDLHVWALDSGKCLTTFKTGLFSGEGHDANVTGVGLAPDGGKALSGSWDRTIRLWDLENSKCVRTIRGHKSFITSVDWTLDCEKAVSGTENGTIRLWNLENGQLLKSYQEHSAKINKVSLSADGTKAISASDDTTLKIWDCIYGKSVLPTKTYSSSITCIKVDPTRKKVLSGSADGSIKSWDLESGKTTRTYKGLAFVHSLCIFPNGLQALIGFAQSMQLWNLETGKFVREFTKFTDPVECINVTPDGMKAITGGEGFQVKVWDLETGECLRTFQGHTWTVNKVALSSNGERALSGSWDGTIRVWNIVTGECLGVFTDHRGRFSFKRINDLSITPDGCKAVSVSRDKTLRIWDLKSMRCIQKLKKHNNWISYKEVLSVSITPDGKKILSGGADNILRLWDADQGKLSQKMIGHSAPVNHVCLSSDGSRAVSTDWNNTLRVWNVLRGECVQVIHGQEYWFYKVSSAPDSMKAISGGGEHPVRIWDLQKGECVKLLDGHNKAVTSLSITPDFRKAISGAEDGTLREWDLASGDSLGQFLENVDTISTVRITPDGKKILSAGRFCHIWDLQRKKILNLCRGHTAYINCLEVTPDGKKAVTGSTDCSLRIWDMESGLCLNSLRGHSQPIRMLAIGPEGRTIISAAGETVGDQQENDRRDIFKQCHARGLKPPPTEKNGDYVIRVWDIMNGSCLKKLEGHSDKITNLIIFPDGNKILSGSEDTTIRLWNEHTGDCVKIFREHQAGITLTNLSVDGRYAVSISKDNIVRLWNIEKEQCLAILELKDAATFVSMMNLQSGLVLGTASGEIIRFKPHLFKKNS